MAFDEKNTGDKFLCRETGMFWGIVLQPVDLKTLHRAHHDDTMTEMLMNWLQVRNLKKKKNPILPRHK